MYKNMVLEVNGVMDEKRFFLGSVISDELFRMNRVVVSDTLEEKKKPKGST